MPSQKNGAITCRAANHPGGGMEEESVRTFSLSQPCIPGY
jgi:hypothetical protein